MDQIFRTPWNRLLSKSISHWRFSIYGHVSLIFDVPFHTQSPTSQQLTQQNSPFIFRQWQDMSFYTYYWLTTKTPFDSLSKNWLSNGIKINIQTSHNLTCMDKWRPSTDASRIQDFYAKTLCGKQQRKTKILACGNSNKQHILSQKPGMCTMKCFFWESPSKYSWLQNRPQIQPKKLKQLPTSLVNFSNRHSFPNFSDEGEKNVKRLISNT